MASKEVLTEKLVATVMCRGCKVQIFEDGSILRLLSEEAERALLRPYSEEGAPSQNLMSGWAPLR